MCYEGQYQHLKIIVKQMLREAGVRDRKMVSEMTVHILEDLYNKDFTDREISNAIAVLSATARLFN